MKALPTARLLALLALCPHWLSAAESPPPANPIERIGILGAFHRITTIDPASAATSMGTGNLQQQWLLAAESFKAPLAAPAFFTHTVHYVIPATEDRWTGCLYNPWVNAMLVIHFGPDRQHPVDAIGWWCGGDNRLLDVPPATVAEFKAVLRNQAAALRKQLTGIAEGSAPTPGTPPAALASRINAYISLMRKDSTPANAPAGPLFPVFRLSGEGGSPRTVFSSNGAPSDLWISGVAKDPVEALRSATHHKLFETQSAEQ